MLELLSAHAIKSLEDRGKYIVKACTELSLQYDRIEIAKGVKDTEKECIDLILKYKNVIDTKCQQVEDMIFNTAVEAEKKKGLLLSVAGKNVTKLKPKCHLSWKATSDEQALFWAQCQAWLQALGIWEEGSPWIQQRQYLQNVIGPDVNNHINWDQLKKSEGLY